MADAYDQILQAAQSYAKQRTATNPWAIGTQAVGALPEGNFDNPWMNIGISALKGFGTGYMGGMAQNSQNAAWADAQSQLLNSLQNGGTVSDPALLPYAQQVQIVQERDKVARQNELADFISKNQYQNDQSLMLELARNGVAMPFAAKPSILEGAPKPPEPRIPGTEPAPTEDTGTLTEAVKELAVTKPSSPLEALADANRKEMERKNKAEQAEFALRSMKELKGNFEKTEDALLEQQTNLAKGRSFITNLESAIDMAGDTAGTVAPEMSESFRRAKLGIEQAFGSEEATKRLQARQNLKSLSLDAAAEIRKAFPGQVSNAEMNMYFKGAPGDTRTKIENLALLEKFKRAQQAAEQSHAFISNLTSMGIPFQQAQAAYMNYDAQNPLFLKTKTGDLEINPVRLGQGVVPGSAPMPGAAPMPTPSGTPVPTQAPSAGDPPPGLTFEQYKAWKRQSR